MKVMKNIDNLFAIMFTVAIAMLMLAAGLHVTAGLSLKFVYLWGWIVAACMAGMWLAERGK
jgi:hypothetical protein